jgi:hypothetical protein
MARNISFNLTPGLVAKIQSGMADPKRLAEAEWREVTAPQAPIRKLPRPDALLETEALMGENFAILEENGEGWCRGELVSDGYPGWIPSSALGPRINPPTHRVSALRTLLFPGPSIKLPPVESPPLGSKLAIRKFDGDLAETESGSFVPAKHVVDLDFDEDDFVAVAEKFVGSPYLWGGKTNAGIDCSGLVQVAITAFGIPCPRDSGVQEQWFGGTLELDADLPELRRGDLLFWPGHVAIVCDPARIIHANAFHMAVTIEPVEDALRRIASAGSPLRSIGRFAKIG